MRLTGRSRQSTSFDQALSRYEKSRLATDRRSVCNAPFNNLYFRADGAVAPCWLQFHSRSPHWSPDGPTIREIWDGSQMDSLRRRLVGRQFQGPCTTCSHEIEVGNRPLAAAYDEIPVIEGWPSMFELELSNHCNLECVMCSGMLSSRIRANREHLPPLESPYDDSFIEQVVEFLPHLRELRINGGEPLLQPLVYSLLEKVAELRPDLKVTIATNGTVLNSKVRWVLENCNIHLNVSIDSLIAQRYEEIRVHARFDVLMRNVEQFIEYTRNSDRILCVMVNPMRSNWDELPEYVRWCNERDIHLWFNTIRYPESVALHPLPGDELRQIRETLLKAKLPEPVGPLAWLHAKNTAVFERFRDVQLVDWAESSPTSRSQPVTISSRLQANNDTEDPLTREAGR
ncbi:MAG: radical SAM protein [Microthrixaceae bacterium]